MEINKDASEEQWKEQIEISYKRETRTNLRLRPRVYEFESKIHMSQKQQPTQEVVQNINEQKEFYNCPICLQDIVEGSITSFGACDHSFCMVCLNSHISTAIERFQMIKCPKEGCLSQLSTTSPHILALPCQIQLKYRQISSMQIRKRYPYLINCPIDVCEGYFDLRNIRKNTQNVKCFSCRQIICGKCFTPNHKGQCDISCKIFLSYTFEYRQCNGCRMLIQMNEGCDHIVCRCGFQFCYLCGQNWFYPNRHECKGRQTLRPSFEQRIKQFGDNNVQYGILGVEEIANQAINRSTVDQSSKESTQNELNNSFYQIYYKHERPKCEQDALNRSFYSYKRQVKLSNQIAWSYTNENHNLEEHSSLAKKFTQIIIAIVVFPIDLIFGFMVLTLPIYIILAFIIRSFVRGLLKMKQECSLVNIILGSIFVYAYFVVTCFYFDIKSQFSCILFRYWRRKYFLPILSHVLIKDKDVECSQERFNY